MSAKWNSIEQFSIESATGNNKVYANGRQSLRVRVAIKVVDINSRPVALSESERLTLTLVNYHGGAELKYRKESSKPEFDRGFGDWDWSLQNVGGYRHYPSTGPQTRFLSNDTMAIQSVDTVYIDFYVRSVSKIPLTVSVRITRDDGEVFESRNYSNGMLSIDPVMPPTYRIADYQLDRQIITPLPANIPDHGVVALHYYRFGMSAGHAALEFQNITLSPGGLYGDVHLDGFGADLVGYTRPGERSINYVFHAPSAPQQLKWPATPGQIIFVKTILWGRDAKHMSSPVKRKPVTQCRVSAHDVYGNLHQMTLCFPNNHSSGGEPELV